MLALSRNSVIQLFFNFNFAKFSSSEPGHTYPAKIEPCWQVIAQRIRTWVADHVPLFEAICVAFSAHILAFPLFWFAGWALPWPKSPEILTVIEIDLSNWAKEGAITKKVTDIIKSEMHAAK